MKKIMQIDAARGRLPKQETVFKIIDELIPHGLNGIIFYMECLAESKAFPVKKIDSYIIPQSYLKEIDSFCKSRNVEFIPHFDVPGHQENLLRIPDMKKYADMEDCIRLDLPEVREKIKEYITEVSSCFSSKYIHCGGDETFRLGMGASREFYRKHGFEKVFSDFVNELNAHVKSLGKTLLFYADVPIVYPGLAGKLDPDIVMNNWAYCIRNECYEAENYHYSRHATGTAGHPLWVTTNCMAEYLFTPFYRLKENVDIWRELGKNAIGLTISDWGTHENCNPYVLSVLGTMYAMHRFENPDYTNDEFLCDASNLILGREDTVFMEAYRILLNASGRNYWSDRALYFSVPVSLLFFGDPDSRSITRLAVFSDPEKFKQLERDIRRAVSLMNSIDSDGVKEPDWLNDLKKLANRVLIAVIRGKLCFRHAFDTGGIWFTDEDLQPIVNEYEEYKSLVEKDRAFLIKNWKRDAYGSALARCLEHYDKTVEETAHAIRLPENILRVYPPEKYSQGDTPMPDSIPVDKKVRLLLKQMTPDEKIDQLVKVCGFKEIETRINNDKQNST